MANEEQEAEDLQPLSEEEIKKKIEKFKGWEYKDNKISKEFQFKDYSDVLNFLGKLIPFCNEIDHHPDTHIYYRKVVFELTRYSIGGKVVERDFTIARKIEELYEEWPK